MEKIFTEEFILNIFKETEALLNGHFKLSSGYHSDTYLQCAKVMQYPELNSILSSLIASHFKSDNINLVIGPAIGGITLAYEVARKLGARSIFAERSGQERKMSFRRGFKINKNDTILIVEDVITTGGSIKEIIELLNSEGINISGVASIVDRSNGSVKLHSKQVSLLHISAPKYEPDKCPLCEKNIPIDTPGSKFV